MFKRLPSVLLLLLGLFATAACSADTTSPGTTAARTWTAGTDYTLIEPPQPTSTGDKIEVVEVFSYACPHCAHFQPYADELKSKLPANAQFVLIPAVFNASWEPFARAFYTAQALGLVDKTHQALFDAIHRDHLPLGSLEALANFYAGYGATSGNFLSTANSFVIDAKMSHGADLLRAYGIEATPTLVVNGKYRVGANSQRNIGFVEMVQIALYLVQQENKAGAAKH
ncbi:MAG TPA: thiol:disulfide interchange protein DsbA/DsbL [Rudaea sp.]|jgi:thiol:disulfide interchange protein DsbA